MRDKISLFLLAIFIAWVSFFPENVQARFLSFVFSLLLALLFLTVKSFSCKKFTIPDIFFWIYITALTFSVIFAVNSELAWSRYFRMVPPIILLYYIIQSGFIRERKRIFSCLVCIFALLVIAIAILEFIVQKNILYEKIWFNPFYKVQIQFRRVMSTQYHPSVLGTYLMACLPFSLFLAFNSKRKGEKLLGAISGFLIILGIVLTSALGAIISSSCIIFLFLWFKRKKILLFLLTLLVFIIVAQMGFEFYSVLNNNCVVRQDYPIDEKLLYKLRRVPTTFKMVKSYPITGVGLDNFRLLFDKFHRCKRYKYIPYEFKIPDNMYLSTIAETGILGSLSFLLFLLMIIIRGTKCLRFLTGEDREFLLLMYFGFLGFLINMLTYDLFSWQGPLYLFWSYVGLIRGYFSKETKSKIFKFTQINEAC